MYSVFFIVESLDNEDIMAIYKLFNDRGIRFIPIKDGKLISVKEEDG